MGQLQESNRVTCLVDDACFEAPTGYSKLGTKIDALCHRTLYFYYSKGEYTISGADVRTQFNIEEENDLLQFAIQQSLLDAGSERDEVSTQGDCSSRSLKKNCYYENCVIFGGGYMGGVEGGKAIATNYT